MKKSRKCLEFQFGVEEESVNEEYIFITENMLPSEIWSMTMDYMDYKTLFTMSMVSPWHKAMAEEKMGKLKSNVEGNFVSIKDIGDLSGNFTRTRTMRMLVVSKDDNGDLMCSIFSSLVIGSCVVQCRQVATINLRSMVETPAVELDQNGVDQTMAVRFNITKLGHDTYNLEILWTEDNKINLVFNKTIGRLLQTVQFGNVKDELLFTKVPNNWQYFVCSKDGLVKKLDFTNVKLRTSSRKVDLKRLLPRLVAALQRSPFPGSLVHSPHFDKLEVFPRQTVEVGTVELRLIRAGIIIDGQVQDVNVNDDHLALLRRRLADVSSGGVVFSIGFVFILCGRSSSDLNVMVKYEVINTSPSPACLVKRVDQVKIT